MSAAATDYDVLVAMSGIITADAALQAWGQAQFGRAVTPLRGNRPFKAIQPNVFPVDVMVFVPDRVEEKYTGQKYLLTEIYHHEIGIGNDNLDTALKQIADYETLLVQAMLAEDANGKRTLGGAVSHIKLADKVGDADGAHPFHYRGLKFQVTRYAPY